MLMRSAPEAIGAFVCINEASLWGERRKKKKATRGGHLNPYFAAFHQKNHLRGRSRRDSLNAITVNNGDHQKRASKGLTACSKQSEMKGIQTFFGLRQGDVLCHVAERRLLYVPESHRSVGEGRPQQELDWKQH